MCFARGLVAAALLTAAVTGCRHPRAPIAPDSGEVVATRDGFLGYRVAFAGDALVSVELGTAFALVRRDLSPRGELTERWRTGLGPPEYDVDQLAIAPSGKHAWVGSRDGLVRAYRLDDGSLAAEWRSAEAVTALAVSSSEQYVTIGTEGGVICIRRSTDGALLQCAVAGGDAIIGLSIAADARTLRSVSAGGTTVTWSLPTLVERHRSTRSEAPITRCGEPARQLLHSALTRRSAVSLSDRQAVLAVADDRGSIRVWDIPATDTPGVCRRQMRFHRRFPYTLRDLDIDRNGRFIAAAVWDASGIGPGLIILSLMYLPMPGESSI